MVLSVLTIASCKKDEETDGDTNTFSLGANTYRATSVTRGANQLTAREGGADAHRMYFTFKTLPKVSGMYKVVYADPGTNELMVTLINPGAIIYQSTGSGDVKAAVTVVDNRTRIVLPRTWAWLNGTPGNDSLRISADVTED
jgi:hypothetical protein